VQKSRVAMTSFIGPPIKTPGYANGRRSDVCISSTYPRYAAVPWPFDFVLTRLSFDSFSERVSRNCIVQLVDGMDETLAATVLRNF